MAIQLIQIAIKSLPSMSHEVGPCRRIMERSTKSGIFFRIFSFLVRYGYDCRRARSAVLVLLASLSFLYPRATGTSLLRLDHMRSARTDSISCHRVLMCWSEITYRIRVGIENIFSQEEDALKPISREQRGSWAKVT